MERFAEIEAECLRLCRAFYVLSDRGEADAYAALYTDDGIFSRPGLSVKGRSEIAEAIRNRPPNMAVRHVGMNAIIEMIDETSARGLGSVLAVNHDRSTGTTALPLVGDFEDSYILTYEGWRIASRVATLAF
jgi:SnoaL-like domain